jgi:CRP-like cAMP-binding protein
MIFTMTGNLKTVLRLFADFDAAELDRIAACFKPRTVRQKSLLLQQGSICKEFYFVGKGSMRVFFMDRNGAEKTRYVLLDNYIGTALTSFIAQQPSVESIEALEDTEILAISHADFFTLNNELPRWKDFYQRILEMAYTFQNNRIEQLVTLTAKQRYEKVLQENPALLQRLSNRVLASYLDIREETLSRLKSE